MKYIHKDVGLYTCIRRYMHTMQCIQTFLFQFHYLLFQRKHFGKQWFRFFKSCTRLARCWVEKVDRLKGPRFHRNVSCFVFRWLVGSWPNRTSLSHLLLFPVFLTILSGLSNDISVHFSTLSIHRIFGLPCFLAPYIQCPAWSLSPNNLLFFSTHGRSINTPFDQVEQKQHHSMTMN